KNAAAAGALRSGDQLVSIDWVSGDPEELRKEIGKHRCAGAQRNGCLAATPATIVVRRGGELVTVRVRPRYDAAKGVERPRLGFAFGTTDRSYDAPEAVAESVNQMWRVTTKTADAITRIFYDPEA